MARRRERLIRRFLISLIGLLACWLLLNAPTAWSRRWVSPRGSQQLRFRVSTAHLASGVAPWPQDIAIDETVGHVYLADGSRGTVTTILGATWLRSIPVGQEATHVAVDPALGDVYVSVPDPYALPLTGEVAVLHAGEVVTRIAAGGLPGPMAVDRNHNRLYAGVNSSLSFADHVLVLQGNRLLGLANTAPGIVALAVDGERERAYVLSSIGPAVSILNGTSTTNVVTLEGAGVARDIAVEPTSGRVYVVSQPPLQSAGITTVLNGTEIVGQVSVGHEPSQVAIHPGTGYAYVSNTGSDTVTIIDGVHGDEPTIIATVPVGPEPAAIAIDDLDDRVYVSNSGDGTTSVLIGTETLTPIAAGGGPIAVDPARGFAYLTGNGVVAARTNSVLGRLPRAAMPSCVAVNPVTELAYVCNDGQQSVSVLHGSQLMATPHLASASRPRAIAADPASGWVYVAAESEVAMLRGATVRASIAAPAVDVAVDTTRSMAYAAADGVAVISGTLLLDTVELSHPPRHVTVHPVTHLAYVTGGGRRDGFVTVVTGTQRTATVPTAGLPGQIVVDPKQDRSFLLYPEQPEVSRIHGVERIFPSFVLPRPWFGPALDAAVHPTTGDLYVTTHGMLARIQQASGEIENLELKALAVAIDNVRELIYVTLRDGSVAVLNEDRVLATLPVDHRPTALAIDELTGRVYVANFGADTVTVIEPEETEAPHETVLRFPFVIH